MTTARTFPSAGPSVFSKGMANAKVFPDPVGARSVMVFPLVLTEAMRFCMALSSVMASLEAIFEIISFSFMTVKNLQTRAELYGLVEEIVVGYGG